MGIFLAILSVFDTGLASDPLILADHNESSQEVAADWVWNPPGEVIAPILLYHHVMDKNPHSRYAVPVRTFELQMRMLSKWGYTAIPLSLLVNAMEAGGYLPAKPVVITFDDGYADIHQHAFPVMRRFGFVGNLFVIVDQLDRDDYLKTGEVRDLLSAGWEAGSHTITHTSLRSPSAMLGVEIDQSRAILEDLFAVPVLSFAYPYGLTSKYVTRWVHDAGYESAVGLGTGSRHTQSSQYYLSRIEVRSDYSLEEFAGLLPWSGPLPADYDRDRFIERKCLATRGYLTMECP